MTSSGEGSSSSSEADHSSSCSITSVHGTHTESGEMADRTEWRQHRQADEAEHGARTAPRRQARLKAAAARQRRRLPVGLDEDVATFFATYDRKKIIEMSRRVATFARKK